MNGPRDTRVCRACSQTTAVIFLFAQTHSIQCSVLAHTLVWTGRGNSTPHLEVLLVMSGPVESICSGFRLCLSMTLKWWLHFRFYPMKQIRSSPAFVFLVMNDCVHSNTLTNQQQDHVGDHAPTKIPWLFYALIG